MPRPEPGERRAAEPVRYKKTQGQPVMYRSYNGLTTQGRPSLAQQQPSLLQNLQMSWQQIQDGLRRGQTAPLNAALRQPFRLAGGVNPFMPTNPTMTPAPPGVNQFAFGQQPASQQVNGAASGRSYPAQVAGGPMENMYAQQAQANWNKQTGQQWYNMRRQQAAYKSTVGQDTMQGAWNFGPGSMEQMYATQAYANAPINMPVVPVDNQYGYGYGGGYGGYGGGSGYVAAEPDIPRWLYGMLSWRYR